MECVKRDTTLKEVSHEGVKKEKEKQSKYGKI